MTLPVKVDGLPPGWLLVDTNKAAHTTDIHAVSHSGVAYSQRLADSYSPASLWRPELDLPVYRNHADWPPDVKFEDDAPLVCPCGNDRLHIVYTGSYETCGLCPVCGFKAVVHDG